MDVYGFDALAEDPANFAAGGNLQCLEAVYSDQANLEPSINCEVVSDIEIDKWICNSACPRTSNGEGNQQHKSSNRPSLQLIALEDLRQIEALAWTEAPLNISRESYNTITTSLKMSPLLLTAALNQDAVYFERFQPPGEKDVCFQYVFRTYSTSRGRFCLGLTYLPKEQNVTAFLMGLRKEEIEELFGSLRSMRRHAPSPVLIPTLLARMYLKYLRDRLSHCHKSTDEVKFKMGLAENVAILSFREPAISGHVELSQGLTTIFSKLAKYDQHCGSILDLLQLLDGASQTRLDAASEEYKVGGGHATAWVRTLISYTQCSTRSSKQWIEVLHRRTQSYVQTVYSLIAQRDRLLSRQLSESSLRIAEATRSDNLAMQAIADNSRIVAEESKSIALESLRKNEAMQSIAIVTMLFLLATFVATFFSTGFFNFRSSSGPIVSSWIWLSAVVAVVLTAIVQGLWLVRVGRSRKRASH